MRSGQGAAALRQRRLLNVRLLESRSDDRSAYFAPERRDEKLPRGNAGPLDAPVTGHSACALGGFALKVAAPLRASARHC
jgi:hypothetical protein